MYDWFIVLTGLIKLFIIFLIKSLYKTLKRAIMKYKITGGKRNEYSSTSKKY